MLAVRVDVYGGMLLVALAGCGRLDVQAIPPTGEPAPDGGVTGGSGVATEMACWGLQYPASYDFSVSACPTAVAASISIDGPTVIDTDSTARNAQGLACAPLTAGSTRVCALAASSITVTATGTLSAHGSLPLALVARSIDVEGAIDAASHVGGPPGPGADMVGCELAAMAVGNGGGQGGTFHADAGGQGGNGMDPVADSGGDILSSIGLPMLRGGCPGGTNAGGGDGVHSGGGVWLAANRDLVVGDSAIIDASGASGIGGRPVAGQRGGFGGGSGGMIVLQAATFTVSPTARIFANGGGGGGGAGETGGGNGVDPTVPVVGGGGGAAASSLDGEPGSGGAGYPAASRAGTAGSGASDGGGGGGGGAGTIWIAAGITVGSAVMSPRPELLPVATSGD